MFDEYFIHVSETVFHYQTFWGKMGALLYFGVCKLLGEKKNGMNYLMVYHLKVKFI